MADFKQRLNAVEDQTKLLLEKQLEAKKYCDASFSDLLSLIDQKVQEADEQSDAYKSLVRIHDLISKQYSEFGGEVEEDIQFLKEQLKAVEEITAIDDDKKAEELFSSILDDDEELLETAKFSKSLDKEASTSKDSFIAIMNDIKGSLEEGDLQDLEVVLNTMVQNKKEDDEFDGEDIFEDEKGFDDCESCDNDCGIDLFSSMFDEGDEEKK